MFGIGFLITLFIVVALLMVLFSFIPVGLWISALAAGVKVGLINLIGMRLRRVPPHKIVLPLIKATKAGLEMDLAKLEAHYLAGGNVDRVVDALIASKKAPLADHTDSFLSAVSTINTSFAPCSKQYNATFSHSDST